MSLNLKSVTIGVFLRFHKNADFCDRAERDLRKCQAMNKLQANCWTPTRGVLSSVFVNYLSGTERKSSWDFLYFPKFEQHRIYEQRNWFVKLFCGTAQHPQSYSALWRGAARETAQSLCFSLLLSNTHTHTHGNEMTDIRIRRGGYR